MKKKEKFELFTEALDDRLDEVSRREFDRLMAEDPSALAQYQSLKIMVGGLRNLPEHDVPPGFAGRVMDRIDQISQPFWAGWLDKLNPKRLAFPLNLAGAAAAIALLVVALRVADVQKAPTNQVVALKSPKTETITYKARASGLAEPAIEAEKSSQTPVAAQPIRAAFKTSPTGGAGAFAAGTRLGRTGSAAGGGAPIEEIAEQEPPLAAPASPPAEQVESASAYEIAAAESAKADAELVLRRAKLMESLRAAESGYSGAAGGSGSDNVLSAGYAPAAYGGASVYGNQPDRSTINRAHRFFFGATSVAVRGRTIAETEMNADSDDSDDAGAAEAHPEQAGTSPAQKQIKVVDIMDDQSAEEVEPELSLAAEAPLAEATVTSAKEEKTVVAYKTTGEDRTGGEAKKADQKQRAVGGAIKQRSLPVHEIFLRDLNNIDLANHRDLYRVIAYLEENPGRVIGVGGYMAVRISPTRLQLAPSPEHTEQLKNIFAASGIKPEQVSYTSDFVNSSLSGEPVGLVIFFREINQ